MDSYVQVLDTNLVGSTFPPSPQPQIEPLVHRETPCRESIGHKFEIPLNHGKEEGVLHVLDITADVPRSHACCIVNWTTAFTFKEFIRNRYFQHRYRTGP